MPVATLRRASVSDADRLSDLALATFRETFLEDFAVPYPPADLARFEREAYGPPALAERLGEAGRAIWVAETDGAFVGFADAGPCGLPHPDVREGELELARLYVRRRHQGEGVGRRLLATALDWMMSQGGGPLWIGVWSGNARAQAVYAAQRFEKVGEYDFPVGGWLDREFILRRG